MTCPFFSAKTPSLLGGSLGAPGLPLAGALAGCRKGDACRSARCASALVDAR
jgi:hypothetical protein